MPTELELQPTTASDHAPCQIDQLLDHGLYATPLGPIRTGEKWARSPFCPRMRKML